MQGRVRRLLEARARPKKKRGMEEGRRRRERSGGGGERRERMGGKEKGERARVELAEEREGESCRACSGRDLARKVF